MILILERCRAKVDEADFGIEKNLSLVGLAANRARRGRDLSVVCEGLIFVLAQKDVLWLQIRVDQVEVVKDWPGRVSIRIQSIQ